MNGSGKYWIPEENELVYFIKRLVYLLLLNSNSIINYPLNSSLLNIDKYNNNQSVDISSVFSWHWHTVLYGFNLASWLSMESKFSLGKSSYYYFAETCIRIHEILLFTNGM